MDMHREHPQGLGTKSWRIVKIPGPPLRESERGKGGGGRFRAANFRLDLRHASNILVGGGWGRREEDEECKCPLQLALYWRVLHGRGGCTKASTTERK
jgi:hypothetical protein